MDSQGPIGKRLKIYFWGLSEPYKWIFKDYRASLMDFQKYIFKNYQDFKSGFLMDFQVPIGKLSKKYDFFRTLRGFNVNFLRPSRALYLYFLKIYFLMTFIVDFSKIHFQGLSGLYAYFFKYIYTVKRGLFKDIFLRTIRTWNVDYLYIYF